MRQILLFTITFWQLVALGNKISNYPTKINNSERVNSTLDSLVIDFASTCPGIPSNFVEFNTNADLLTCSGSNLRFNGFGVGIGESWLITPKIKFGTKSYQMNFRAENDFDNVTGLDVEVYYSTDYAGSGDPKSFTWKILQSPTDFFNVAPKPTNPTNSPIYNLSNITQEAYIAFVYYSSGTGSGGSSRVNFFNLSIKPQVEAAPAGDKKIAEIQGKGKSSPLLNKLVKTTGVVTQIFLGKEPFEGAGYTSNLNGFYLQDRHGDENDSTSEALYISANNPNLAIGDSITLTGTVSEANELTQLINISDLVILAKGLSIPAPISIANVTDLEKVENMLIAFNTELHVTETRNLDLFGELKLSFEDILYQPTQLLDPSNTAAISQMQSANKMKSFILDDGRIGSGNNPIAYLGMDKSLRAGTTISDLTGILTQGFGTYRLFPTKAPIFDYAPADKLPTLAKSAVKVISFNVLNYFNGDGKGAGFPTSRGAKTPALFAIQTKKIVTAMKAMDGDIYALMEIENDEDNGFSAIKTLVDSLNSAYGSSIYTFVKTGRVTRANKEFDEIKNAFIYKTTTVDTIGLYKILDNDFSANYFDGFNRPSIAQTFIQKSNGAKFTAVTCHLKSKGSDCNDNNDPDKNDGQGNCNLTRKSATTVMASWLATDPTHSNDDDFLILGDLNSYAKEDPIKALNDAGFKSLKSDSSFSYVFDGQFGSLDYAMGNSSLMAQVASTDVWHINSIENDFKAYDSNDTLRSMDERWSSDHDPIIVQLLFFVTGIDQNDSQVFKAYPNPTTGDVTFSNLISGTLFNEFGVEISQFQNAKNLNLNDLTNGIYFVKPELGAVIKITLLR